MNLRDTTRDILSQVEHLTGYPVEVVDDPCLPTPAVDHMANRWTLRAHKTKPKYTLRTLPGEFSALNVVAIMVAAFEQFAPGTDMGIDLAREYEAAVAMRG